jgi:hypothetical protein
MPNILPNKRKLMLADVTVAGSAINVRELAKFLNAVGEASSDLGKPRIEPIGPLCDIPCMQWPFTIPYDLLQRMEELNDWQAALRAWAKFHKLHLKIQWFPNLERRMAELEEYRFQASDQDRWARIKEWLEAKGVEAPEGLLVSLDVPSSKL